MNPSLHPRTIQEVKDKADIVDVISEHIVLKKKGKEFVGICRFHDDTKPVSYTHLTLPTICSV